MFAAQPATAAPAPQAAASAAPRAATPSAFGRKAGTLTRCVARPRPRAALADGTDRLVTRQHDAPRGEFRYECEACAGYNLCEGCWDRCARRAGRSRRRRAAGVHGLAAARPPHCAAHARPHAAPSLSTRAVRPFATGFAASWRAGCRRRTRTRTPSAPTTPRPASTGCTAPRARAIPGAWCWAAAARRERGSGLRIGRGCEADRRAVRGGFWRGMLLWVRAQDGHLQVADTAQPQPLMAVALRHEVVAFRAA
jgi:hypothetical protein